MLTYTPLPLPTESTKPLPDSRLRQRLHWLVETFSRQYQCSIPQATGNRNDMDATYQFFKNPRVHPAAVVASCLPGIAPDGEGCLRVLALQDSTDLNYSGLTQTTGLGHTDGPGGRGLKLHSTLAVNALGIPLGLLTQQFWARDPQHKGKVKDRRQRHAQDKESYRWQDHAQAARQVLAEVLPHATVVHVADREGDIYDWLAAKRPANAHLLIRVAQAHRVVVHGPEGTRASLAAAVRAAPVLGRQTLVIPRADERPAREATLTVRAAAVLVQPPKHAKERSQLPAVPVWVVEAVEEAPPAGTKPICWRLVTTEEVSGWEQALQRLREYVLRWLIERFHFVLKSGCRVEQLQLEDADRLANAVAVYSQVAVRVLRLAYLARVEPERPALTEFNEEELAVLSGCRAQDRGASGPVRTVAEAVAVVARRGGHLGRKGDGPPGVQVLWRGLRSLHDLVLGYRLAQGQRQSATPPPQPLVTKTPIRSTQLPERYP